MNPQRLFHQLHPAQHTVFVNVLTHKLRVGILKATKSKFLFNKGSQVYLEGRLQTRKWQGQDGQDRYTTEVVIDLRGTMQMLGSRGANNQVRDVEANYGANPPGPSFPSTPDDDIPF